MAYVETCFGYDDNKPDKTYKFNVRFLAAQTQKGTPKKACPFCKSKPESFEPFYGSIDSILLIL